MNDAPAKSSLTRRLIALVVLAIAAWLLLKIVIGFLAGIATALVVIGALFAVVWAVRTL